MEEVFQAMFTRNNQFYGTSHHLSWTNTGFWKSEASLPSDLHSIPIQKEKQMVKLIERSLMQILN